MGVEEVAREGEVFDLVGEGGEGGVVGGAREGPAETEEEGGKQDQVESAASRLGHCGSQVTRRLAMGTGE